MPISTEIENSKKKKKKKSQNKNQGGQIKCTKSVNPI